MNKIENALWQDYNDADERLNELTPESKEYGVALEEKDKIRKELIEVGQIKEETKIKMSQIDSENTREKHRNLISLGTFGVTTIVSLIGLFVTLDFDREHTVTSSMGKGILNGFIPKFNKR